MGGENKDHAGSEVPVWLRPDWEGPKVELRSEATDGDSWPEGAVERVVFRVADFASSGLAIEDLPYVQSFGSDGWPIECPEDVKPQLDPRMKAEFHARPWSVNCWSRFTWLRAATNFDDFRRWNEHASLIAGPLKSLTGQSG